MKKINFWTELINRIKGKTPVFFKKLRDFGLWLSGVGGAILLIPNIPESVTEITGYVVAIGVVISSISVLPVVNPDYENLDKKE